METILYHISWAVRPRSTKSYKRLQRPDIRWWRLSYEIYKIIFFMSSFFRNFHRIFDGHGTQSVVCWEMVKWKRPSWDYIAVQQQGFWGRGRHGTGTVSRKILWDPGDPVPDADPCFEVEENLLSMKEFHRVKLALNHKRKELDKPWDFKILLNSSVLLFQRLWNLNIPEFVGFISIEGSWADRQKN